MDFLTVSKRVEGLTVKTIFPPTQVASPLIVDFTNGYRLTYSPLTQEFTYVRVDKAAKEIG